MDFNKLCSLICEDVFDLQHDDGTFESAMKLFYELSYKLNIANHNKFVGSSARRENIILKLEEKLIKNVNYIKPTMMKVFDTWLRSHNITNPKQWAITRIKRDYDDEEGRVTFIQILLSYMEQKFANENYCLIKEIPIQDRKEMAKKVDYTYIDLVDEKINEYNVFKQVLLERKKNYIDDLYSELSSYYSEESEDVGIVYNH